MTRKINGVVVLGTRSARRTRRPRRQHQPTPAPVVIVRAASVAATQPTPAQRARRAAARRRAAEATDAARRGWPASWDDPGLRMRIEAVPQAARILQEAPTIAADPAAGAVEVGRDLHGRPVAVVLHAPTWSLVIHRTGNPNQPVTSRAYLDGYSTDAPPDFCFDADCTVTGVEWSDMIAAVLAAVT